MNEAMRFVDFNQTFKQCTNADMVWDVAKNELAKFGFTSFLHGVSASRQEIKKHKPSQSLIWRCDYPEDYLAEINFSETMDLDLSIEVILEDEICLWHGLDELISTSSKELRCLNEIENEMGMAVGVSIPTMLFDANSIGGFGVCAGELDADEFDLMWAHKKNEVLKILGAVDLALRDKHMEEIINLTVREKDVLSYLAIGLRLNDIADQMNISVKTLEKYVASAKIKLKAKTRDHAVVKALHFNVIQL